MVVGSDIIVIHMLKMHSFSPNCYKILLKTELLLIATRINKINSQHVANKKNKLNKITKFKADINIFTKSKAFSRFSWLLQNPRFSSLSDTLNSIIYISDEKHFILKVRSYNFE